MPRRELGLLPVCKKPFSAVLDIVLGGFDGPLPGGTCQLRATRTSWTSLLLRSFKVYLACLESNADHTEHDGDQRVQI